MDWSSNFTFTGCRDRFKPPARVFGVKSSPSGSGPRFSKGAVSSVSIWLLEAFPSLQNIG